MSWKAEVMSMLTALPTYRFTSPNEKVARSAVEEATKQSTKSDERVLMLEWTRAEIC